MKHVHTWNSLISAFVMARDRGDLNLTPSYQREWSWCKEQQELLIDSILCKIPLPAIFIRDYELSLRTDVEIIDGRHRISTILDYIDGGFIPENLPAFKDLVGHKFLSFPMIVYKCTDWSDIEVLELYNRLNFAGTPHKGNKL